jgi:adenylyltransferase/sulfurtransferase
LSRLVDLGVEAGRYARQELITWWEQDRLARGRVLVVGAGALGNELVKNLVLLGVGHVDVVDMDAIEASNLARCSLFRLADVGRPKVEVLAEVASAMNPDCAVTGHAMDIRRWPLGRLAGVDVVIGGLDNREARLFVNQACRKLGIPWVDGAIEGLRGIAKVFLPDGPCYECTLGEVDRKILAARKSCGLLTDDELLDGKVPTTITSAAIVAGVQVQEAVKLLHGDRSRLALRNQGWTFVGETGDAYVVDYGEDEWCPAHDRYGELRPWPAGGAAGASTGASARASAGASAGVDAPLSAAVEAAAGVVGVDGVVDAVDFEGDVVVSSHCATCDQTRPVLRRLVDLDRSAARCPACSTPLTFDTRTSLAPDDELLVHTPAALGLPAGDVVSIRGAAGRLHYQVGTAT